ncbi:MAG: hypothetical protein V3W14_13765 [Candidatus Neomarinimicrobiota bacterium]
MKPSAAILLFVALLHSQELYVRRDAITFKADYYAPLDTITMAQFWEQTAVHSEAFYNGDGSWGLGFFDWPTKPYDADHPLVRAVAYHVMGLLLLMENDLSDPGMIARCRISLNWMLERQTPEGAWPLYITNRGIISSQSVIPTALAGITLSRGYRVLGNPRYLLAASRALEWQRVRPEDDSPRNHGLLLLQLMEHYRTVHDLELLEWAVSEAQIILGRQQPSGTWADPAPVTTGEHAIIATALLQLDAALVDIDPNKRRIKEGGFSAINFLLENQVNNGNFSTGPTEITNVKVPTLEIIALIQARTTRNMAEFDMPIRGAVRALNLHPSNLGPHWRANQADRFLAMSHAVVWFTDTQSKRAYTDLESEAGGGPLDTVKVAPGEIGP